MDACEQSGSPTLLVNGGIPQARTVLVQQIRCHSDSRQPLPVSPLAGPSNFGFDQEIWNVERRLNGLEEKITGMESKFTRTLNEILKIIREKESLPDDSDSETRTTTV